MFTTCQFILCLVTLLSTELSHSVMALFWECETNQINNRFMCRIVQCIFYYQPLAASYTVRMHFLDIWCITYPCV